MMSSLRFSICVLVTILAIAPLPAGAAPSDPSQDSDQILQSRAVIEARMAADPDNERLQEAGRHALSALDAWEQEMQMAETVLMETSETPAEQPAAAALASAEPDPFPNVLSKLDSWNINENFVGVSVAHADWTIDEVFPGTKLILDAQYSFKRGPGDIPHFDCDCVIRPRPYRMVGTVGLHLQKGQGETGLEYGYLSFTSLGYQRNFLPEVGRFRPLRDTLEIGGAKVGKDDPLGVDSYAEITIARIGRTWSLIRENSNTTLLVGLGGSVGWAWADSLEPDYNEVSNPFMGAWVTLAAAHPRWGKLYVEQRTINGFTFSSPSAGGSTSREARFKFGYVAKLWSCMSMELYVDKRSFNFSDHRLADLYTKSRRTGVELGCAW